MMVIEGSALVAEIRRLAKQYPDRIAKCEYVDGATGEPVCIVGTALHNLGVSTSVLDDFGSDRFRAVVEATELCHRLGAGPEITFDLKDLQLSWVDFVQGKQDAEFSWGRAVGTTEHLYPGVE